MVIYVYNPWTLCVLPPITLMEQNSNGGDLLSITIALSYDVYSLLFKIQKVRINIHKLISAIGVTKTLNMEITKLQLWHKFYSEDKQANV